MKITLETLTKQHGQAPYPPHVLESVKQSAKTIKLSSPHEMPYLGESSFAMHSQQTGQILDKALRNSPVPGQDVTSSLQSLHYGGNGADEDSFTTDLPMPPVQVALAALRIMDGTSALADN